MTWRAGRRPPPVSLASPVGQPPRVRHSSRMAGPPARWIAPSTPPPPSRVVLAAFTMASVGCRVMSPWTSSRHVPSIVRVRIARVISPGGHLPARGRAYPGALAHDAPLFASERTLAGSPGPTRRRVGRLTPYALETLADDARCTGPGDALVLTVPHDTDGSVLAHVRRRLNILARHGLRV